ncbi:MAG: hypothetical protein Q4C42_11780, partial [Clostridia bacterium]|nr:hypothetical protein [Clostridia bacterium]
MKCNYKNRTQDHVTGSIMDNGLGIGIMITEILAYELFGIGAKRLKKLEAAINREIEKAKKHGKWTEQRCADTEEFIYKANRDYQDIFTAYNYRYRNYPDRQLTWILKGDERDSGIFRNVSSTSSDELFDAGLIIGIQACMVHLNYNLQIGAPRLSVLEKAVIDELKEKRKYKIQTMNMEFIERYNRMSDNYNARFRNHPE